jgi:hypothetical protein
MLAVVGACAVVLGAIFVYYVARGIQAERSGDSEGSFYAIVAAGIALVACVISGALFALLRSRGAVHAAPSAPVSERLVPPYALASVSAVAGVLAWLPLLPLVSPLGYAAIAVVVGMLGVRSASLVASERRELVASVVGVGLGLLHFIVRMVLDMQPRPPGTLVE